MPSVAFPSTAATAEAASSTRCAITARVVACARTTNALPGYIHRADVMTRLPALLLAGCAVLTGLILIGHGLTSGNRPLFEGSPPASEIKTGAQAREIAEQPHSGMQRSPEATPRSMMTTSDRPS